MCCPTRRRRRTDGNSKVIDVSTFVDTWREMQKLLATGKVRNIGVNNMGIQHLEKLLSDPSCRIVPAVNQIELHPANPSPKLLAYSTAKGIHSSAYSPLGSTASKLCPDATILGIAKAKGCTQQKNLLWGLRYGTSVLPKSITKERIESNLDLGAVNKVQVDVAGTQACQALVDGLGASATRACHQLSSLVVSHISSRGTLESLIASPTSFSLP